VKPEDPEALRGAILHLYEHPDHAESLGRNGREYVRQNYCRDRLADRYLEVLREVVVEGH
jgi:glycosyltransferase involved in cell wall biosynthesis